LISSQNFAFLATFIGIKVADFRHLLKKTIEN